MAKLKAKKSLVITLVAHQPYMGTARHGVPHIWKTNLFPAITDTYIPLLRMCTALVKDEIPFRFAMVISPTLCAMLDDPAVQESYLDWLDSLIDFGECEVERTKNMRGLRSLSVAYVKKLKQVRSYFTDVCKGLILSKFKEYAQSGHIELMATAASFCFFPHYQQLKEAVDAQIEMGIISHRNYFGSVPDGFWLPLLGYSPGLEKNIRKYGFSYTILDTHGVLFAVPAPASGIFSPLRCTNALSIFGRDHESPDDIIGTDGFMYNPVYRNQNRDIGFEAKAADLQVYLGKNKGRFATGFRYWARKGKDVPYSSASAKKQISLDADAFLDKKSKKLEAAKKALGGKSVSLILTLEAHDLGQSWFEGINWLEQVFRKAAERNDLDLTHCSLLIDNPFSLQKIEPFMSAAAGSGYGENLLDKTNSRILRYVRKAAERMIDLACRFPDDTGLKERSLNLAAKQILLGQASDWPKMIHEDIHTDFAEAGFENAVLGFSTIYDSLGANSISTEWLTRTEKDYPLFSWINYRVFRKKR